tara:strand:+ start:1552 stop:1896 length:345 start_codon:yes stop_codon:yes gene_type:complete
MEDVKVISILKKVLVHEHSPSELRQLAYDALDEIHREELMDLCDGGYKIKWTGGSMVISKKIAEDICACGKDMKLNAINVLRAKTNLEIIQAKDAIEDPNAPWRDKLWYKHRDR